MQTLPHERESRSRLYRLCMLLGKVVESSLKPLLRAITVRAANLRNTG